MPNRLFAAIAALLFGIEISSAAEPPACAGKSILPELASTAPELSARLASAEKDIPNGEAVLWRIIDKTGQAEPSHLFGTIHLTDPRVHALSEEARNAIAKARVVALEVKEVVDPRAHIRAYYRNARFTAMPLGQDMWDLIPDEDERFIREAPQIPPERMITLGAVQPWMVAFTLSYPMCEVARQKADLPVLDRAIGQLASAHGVAVVGLEKVEEQMAILAGAPLEQQARFLVMTARYGSKIEDMAETFVQLHAGRRLSSMLLLSIQGVPTDQTDAELSAFMKNELIDKRNRIMAERALPLLTDGNAFIAVGAAHLPGDQGLVELFRKAGYEVTPVN
ncbi:TraB/GumN family protein [Nordella sp. HKS 07]|uniref:TraB/GumN family protein n=1 Tax=Nordella sp. HKS 07 TaxID=2712222 RepID=UPI0013E14B32|nr:TraB/GumN family protein [Nordella sp. HKS 07]QIG47946.1 TraB/GumN family protein [Nordella sp. HKS 07]